MIAHTNDFKDEIKQFGRQINGIIYKYSLNYKLNTEDNKNIITEDNIQLITNNFDISNEAVINNENIYSMNIVKQGQLLQSLMKEFDFEIKDELLIGDIVNPQFGLLVNGSYEYLDYGNYIIYSKEYNADNKTWSYVSFDKMLFSMVKYEPLNISYPITLREYIDAICNRIGLEFANINDTFTNYNQLIGKDVYKDMNVTYRDILDDISEMVAGNLCINDNGELEIKYPTNSNDTINEEYLKDINVTFSEKFGAINKIIITDTEVDVDYVATDDISISTNGVSSITISNNLLVQNGEQQTIAQNILTQLSGLEYYLNDFTTTGICYYEFLDLFNVSIEGINYPCLLLNNEINITTGLTEQIYTEKREESETKTDKYEISTPNMKTVQFKINQQEGKLESKVEKNGVISAINQSAEEVQIQANKISLEGKEINLTSDNIIIDSTNFNVDANGNMTCNNASIGGDLTQVKQLQDYSTRTNIGDPYNTGNCIEVYSFDTGNENNVRNKTFINPGNVATYRGDDMVALFGYDRSVQLYNEYNTRVIYLDGYDGSITCVSLTQTSEEKAKKNFEKYNNALDIIKNIDIYKYNLKEENDTDKKHIGFVIGDNFKYSKEVTSKNNDGVDLYGFISVCCQAIKEQQELIEELNNRIQLLERKK